MKKIKYIVLLLAVSFLGSCEDDGGESKINATEGVVANLVKAQDADQIIDFLGVQAGNQSNLKFDVNIAQGSSTSNNITGFYATTVTNTDGEEESRVYNTVLFDNATLPGTFSLDTDGLINAFTELNNQNDIKLGDVLTISTSHVLGNGTEVKILNDDSSPNIGSNIRTQPLFTPIISYPVSCPSDLAGNYIATITATSGDISAY